MPPVEDKYRELLCPIKDPEKSFAVNICELLASYVDKFRYGNNPPNFNSAALLIQGSSSIYGKKVEFLYNLAISLHDNLLKYNKKGDDSKKKDPKDRIPRQGKLVDPFCSTEIKPGKNLSCLNRKNILKKVAVSKKSQKKGAEKIYSFVPVDLLPLEGEGKGDVFYDTYGEAIGNKGDYTLNKCRVTTSGWLLLPTVSPDLVSDLSLTSDYSAEIEEDDNRCDSDVDVPNTPVDEGYPASSGFSNCPPTASGSQVVSSQATDEGLGSLQSTPSDSASQPVEAVEMVIDPDAPVEEAVEVANVAVGIENIPVDNQAEENFPAGMPIRRSMRQALRTRQLNAEVEKEKKVKKADMVAVVKIIQKENTCHLPLKLRDANTENALHPASVFCARTFFSLDSKFQKSDLLSLKVTAFANNSKFISQISKYKDAIKAAKSNKSNVEQNEDDEIEVGGIEEVLNEPDADCAAPNPTFNYHGSDIRMSPTHSIGGDDPPFADEIPIGEEIEEAAREIEVAPNEIEGASNEIPPEPVDDLDAEIERLAIVQTTMYKNELQNYVRTSEVNEKVRIWQKRLAPFLREINSREKFDIDLYGSRILNAFDDSNRRQSIVFRDFCKGKQKWEIHRYFMALLPLANMGNVNLENEPRDDGEEDDTLITLLSRKMHHLELEEFGHNAGEHS